MRPAHFLTCLAFGFMASQAIASSTWFQLDSGNVKSQPLVFRIETEKTPQGGVLFYVDVESKRSVLSETVAASLTVVRGNRQIARVDIKEKKHGNGVRFAFEVSPNYLVESKFAFKDLGGTENPWVTDVYWFLLKDFSSEK